MTFAGQLLQDLVVPPIGAAVVWVGGTGWLNAVYGGQPTAGAKKMRKVMTWAVFVFLLVAGFSITLYAHFTGWRYRP